MKFKPQYARLLFIDRKIAEKCFPNCRTLAEEWEVSTKTLQRDIDYLRDELGVPVAYDYQRRGYFYTEANYRLPTINMNASELFAVTIAEMALKRFQNTPLYNQLSAVFEKIEESLPDQVTVHPAWVDNRIIFFNEPSTTINPEIWATIASALREDRKLRITHKSPTRPETSRRVVNPYHLINYRGEWYLSSYCHSAESIRTFGVSRIRSAVILDEPFAMPESHDRDKMFGDQLGIIWNRKFYRVRIAFDAEVAPYIKERVWHPQQEITNRRDGGIVLSFTTNHLNEVKDWVLSWGGRAKVLAPQKLVDRAKEALAAALERYHA